MYFTHYTHSFMLTEWDHPVQGCTLTLLCMWCQADREFCRVQALKYGSLNDRVHLVSHQGRLYVFYWLERRWIWYLLNQVINTDQFYNVHEDCDTICPKVQESWIYKWLLDSKDPVYLLCSEILLIKQDRDACLQVSQYMAMKHWWSGRI